MRAIVGLVLWSFIVGVVVGDSCIADSSDSGCCCVGVNSQFSGGVCQQEYHNNFWVHYICSDGVTIGAITFCDACNSQLTEHGIIVISFGSAFIFLCCCTICCACCRRTRRRHVHHHTVQIYTPVPTAPPPQADYTYYTTPPQAPVYATPPQAPVYATPPQAPVYATPPYTVQ